MNPKVKAAFEKHVKASPSLGFHALVFGVRADGLYLSARKRMAYEMFAAGYEARSVESVADAVVASRSDYEAGGDAYESGSPYDMDRSQDWRDGWEDTKDLMEQGK